MVGRLSQNFGPAALSMLIIIANMRAAPNIAPMNAQNNSIDHSLPLADVLADVGFLRSLLNKQKSCGTLNAFQARTLSPSRPLRLTPTVAGQRANAFASVDYGWLPSINTPQKHDKAHMRARGRFAV